MADFQEHINQATKNLNFLQQVNLEIKDYWDWQVTICFYVAIHAVNAHLSQAAGLHYRRHNEVEHAINPYIEVSITKFPESEFKSYMKLKGLARRSRYLVHDSQKETSDNAHFTFDKHLAKAVRHLDVVLKYLTKLHSFELAPIDLICIELKENDNLNHFNKRG